METLFSTKPKDLPIMLDAKALQAQGISRSMAYHLLNRADTGVVVIGWRKFLYRERFLAWLEAQTGNQGKER
ncbi:MAG: DNA-binding protein [Clostridia bacterium]|nr:DNA-binding protein [Clostridia bacterium]